MDTLDRQWGRLPSPAKSECARGTCHLPLGCCYPGIPKKGRRGRGFSCAQIFSQLPSSHMQPVPVKVYCNCKNQSLSCWHTIKQVRTHHTPSTIADRTQTLFLPCSYSCWGETTLAKYARIYCPALQSHGKVCSRRMGPTLFETRWLQFDNRNVRVFI